MSKKNYSFKLVGLVKDPFFHMGKAMLEDVKLKYGKDMKISVEIVEQLEFDWRTFVNQLILNEKGEMWMFKDNCVFFNEGSLLGGMSQFQQFLTEEFQYSNYRPLPLYEAMAEEAYQKHFADQNQDVVYFDVTINNASTGRLLVQLFNDKCPKTCYNFKCLCTGEKGRAEESGIKLHYQGSLFHRVVKNGWVQGGDIDLGKGNGGSSIYGPQFEDESFAVSHDRRGIVGMANHGRHSNRSQFFITFQKCTWMDRKYVAFGRVVEGFDVLNELESQETYNERPKRDCVIESCGVFYDTELAAKIAKEKEEERKQLAIQLANTRILPTTPKSEPEKDVDGVNEEAASDNNELVTDNELDMDNNDLTNLSNIEQNLNLEQTTEAEEAVENEETADQQQEDTEETGEDQVDESNEDNNKDVDALEQVTDGASNLIVGH